MASSSGGRASMKTALYSSVLPQVRSGVFALALFGATVAFAPSGASAQVTAFKQSVAEFAAGEGAVAKFYRESAYTPIWTAPGEESMQRRAALLRALEEASAHGLPDQSALAASLMEQMRNARSARDLGQIEAALSTAYVNYATDLQTGLLDPGSIDDGIVRKKHTTDPVTYLEGIRDNQPMAYMRSLVPASPQYRALLREKFRLEQLVAKGGWGTTVPKGKLEPGDTGPAVIALRDRLVTMGYLPRSATAAFDMEVEQAVQKFQSDHGLEVDGVAGDGTIAELNKPVTERLKSVVVAMERERWLSPERGERHILVNQTDFTAKIVDRGDVTFETRSVIGKNQHDRRSPEFSDVMEHMIINPSWHVPRSIITKEYLPVLQKNPNAVGHLQITDSRGRVVNRSSVDFTQFSSRSFPFAMRQPPGRSNALGLVKFMFPNKHNIYLHDTPQKHLFSREVRAYSHGCIRLAQPFEFAYALLSQQRDNPVDYFHEVLGTGRETQVDLREPLPVHLIYRTAISAPKGGMEYRRDVYGRDRKIWDALEQAGVALNAIRG